MSFSYLCHFHIYVIFISMSFLQYIHVIFISMPFSHLCHFYIHVIFISMLFSYLCHFHIYVIFVSMSFSYLCVINISIHSLIAVFHFHMHGILSWGVIVKNIKEGVFPATNAFTTKGMGKPGSPIFYYGHG